MRPSLSDRLPEGVPHPFDYILQQWDTDPDSYASFEEKTMQGWLDLKAAKRRLWKERGYVHYEHMDDEELTDSPHTVLFPNVTLSCLPDNLIFSRTEPDTDDPSKCTFDLWLTVYPVDGQDEVESVMAGPQPLKEAELTHRAFDHGQGIAELEGQIVYQDVMLSENQQRGMKSRGYADAHLAGQKRGCDSFMKC
jgi:Ring hydroxylating alpha subunit (catalytic domain)